MKTRVWWQFSLVGYAGVVALLVAAVGLAAGCGPAQAPTAASKHLTFVQGAGPANLDPHLATAGMAMPFWAAMFDALTRFDQNMKPVPSLASSWRIVNDTTWELKLRTGVKFHNGEPFNAGAAKFSLDRIMNPATKSANLSRMSLLQKVEIVDDSTLRIITKAPFANLPLGLTWSFMLPPKYVSEKGDAYIAQNPVGTGPFKFVDWVQGQYANMAANPDYWQGRPKLDKLTIKTIADTSVRVASLKAGESQLIGDIDVQVAKQVQGSQGLKIVPSLALSVMVIALYSHEGGPLADKRVRQALNYAIDKQLILDKVLQGYSAIAQGQVVTPEAFGFDPETKPYPYDLQKAKQLLAEAGHPNGFKMPLTTSWGRFPMDKEVSTALVDQLSKVGVQAEINNLEWGVFSERRLKWQTPNFLSSWVNYGDAIYSLQAGSNNTTMPYWKNNAEFDRTLTQSNSAMDPKEREQLLRQAIRYQKEEAPVIFLFQPANILAVSERLTGWQPEPTGAQTFYQADLK